MDIKSLFAYSGAQPSAQVLGTSDTKDGFPSWLVFVGVAVILAALASLYIFIKRRNK